MLTATSAVAVESNTLFSRYAARIAGRLGCLDRVIVMCSLLDVCHPAAQERQVHFAGMWCSDLVVFAEPLLDALRDHTGHLARAGPDWRSNSSNARTSGRRTVLLVRRSLRPGLVLVFLCDVTIPQALPRFLLTTSA